MPASNAVDFHILPLPCARPALSAEPDFPITVSASAVFGVIDASGVQLVLWGRCGLFDRLVPLYFGARYYLSVGFNGYHSLTP